MVGMKNSGEDSGDENEGAAQHEVSEEVAMFAFGVNHDKQL
jgi:hypothetical protein